MIWRPLPQQPTWRQLPQQRQEYFNSGCGCCGGPCCILRLECPEQPFPIRVVDDCAGNDPWEGSHQLYCDRSLLGLGPNTMIWRTVAMDPCDPTRPLWEIRPQFAGPLELAGGTRVWELGAGSTGVPNDPYCEADGLYEIISSTGLLPVPVYTVP